MRQSTAWKRLGADVMSAKERNEMAGFQQGVQTKAPWEKRGDDLPAWAGSAVLDNGQAYPLLQDTENHDLAAACAGFYLRDAIAVCAIVPVPEPTMPSIVQFLGGDGEYNKWTDPAVVKPWQIDTQEVDSTVSRANARQEAFIAEWAPRLRQYLHYAIAGELSYHRSLKNFSGGDYYTCENRWMQLVQAIGGEQAAKDAAVIFRDQKWAPGYGGEKWAIICDVLAMYEGGLLPDLVFIDRVWNLQHNGGTCLNKTLWGSGRTQDGYTPNSLNILQYQVLPAHGESNWEVLFKNASAADKMLFADHFEACKRLAKQPNLTLTEVTIKAMQTTTTVEETTTTTTQEPPATWVFVRGCKCIYCNKQAKAIETVTTTFTTTTTSSVEVTATAKAQPVGSLASILAAKAAAKAAAEQTD